MALAVGAGSLLLYASGPLPSRSAQMAYVALLALPPLLLAAGEGALTRAARWRPGAWALATAGIALAWLLAVALPVLGHSHAATVVDLWQSHLWLEESVADGSDLLRGRGQPGVARIYMLLLLPNLLPSGGAELLERVQAIHAGWLALTGLGVGALAAATVRRSLAPVAAAAFLFSPFVLALRFSPSPFGIFTALGVGQLLLLHVFVRTASGAALVALASVAGLSLMTAYLYPVLAFAGLVTAWRLLRGPALPVPVIGAAALAFVAGALPSIPDLAEIRAMSALYVDREGAWQLLEAILLGQRNAFGPPGTDALWASGRAGPLDVPIGALLSPFAVPRTPLRLWADSLLEPAATALAALGLALALRSARRPGSAMALAALGVAILPAALASAYDRASLLRNVLMPVALSVLAAAGLAALRRGPGGSRRGVLAVTGLLASGGWIYFTAVALPRLPASSLAIAVRAVGEAPPPGGVAFLDFGWPVELPWLHVRPVLEQIPASPIPRIVLTGPDAVAEPGGGPAAEVLLWSPSLEDHLGVTGMLCERWPRTEIYILVDRSGLARTFGARPAGPGWTPALPPGRFSHADCEQVRSLAAEARE